MFQYLQIPPGYSTFIYQIPLFANSTPLLSKFNYMQIQPLPVSYVDIAANNDGNCGKSVVIEWWTGK